ncbi:aspartate/glutamate racemase family protein [Kribbella karoonensis]|uniref:Aspartate/glutamate racemase family protein n=1 Tax=Kribbella karoonensis TaxID=324851 RepID=A0ABN2ELV1_9ACTN
MRIKVVNPNSTASMTALIGECARAVAGPGVTVDAVNPPHGPAAIESHADDAYAVPGLLREIVDGEAAGYDGYVIACFGDPGLKAARELARGPVVGIAEAGMRTAAYLGRGFSVVTTLARTVGHAHDLAEEYGVARQCLGIHACEIPVLALETDPHARATILRACEEALALDGSDAIVLGCAGMADLCHDLSTELGVSVIDGVAAATATVEMLVRMRLRTGKLSEFAPHPRYQTA